MDTEKNPDPGEGIYCSAISFLEAGIPPELVRDQPSCTDTRWSFYFMAFWSWNNVRPHFAFYISAAEVNASMYICLWEQNLASHVFGLWILLLPDLSAACFVSQFSNTFLDIDWKLLSHV